MKKILFLIAVTALCVNLIGHQVYCAETTKSSKAAEAVKDATDKTVSATKNITKKTVKATKKGYKKTVSTTKDLTDKTVEGTKNVFDNLNPNKPVTLSELETQAQIRTLKNEKKGIKSAYNSRIKDINAKIKAAEVSTTLNETQKQSKIYSLTKEKDELISQRDAAIFKYDSQIKELQSKK